MRLQNIVKNERAGMVTIFQCKNIKHLYRGTLDIKMYKYTQHLHLSATLLLGLNLYEKVNH